MPNKRPMTKEGNLPWNEYIYDEYYDCILCPHDKKLRYSTTNRGGLREYKSKPYICKNCPDLFRCTTSQQSTKTVTMQKDYLE